MKMEHMNRFGYASYNWGWKPYCRLCGKRLDSSKEGFIACCTGWRTVAICKKHFKNREIKKLIEDAMIESI